MKTQHRYASIREFALKTLATLILEDFLKFRGPLLIYILAGLLDTQREIKELAAELIMKYTAEKNELFIRTCLLECPFVFNASPCFGQTMADVSKSGNILKDETKQMARQIIYRYMIRKVDPIHLYMYFGNVTRLLDHMTKESALCQSSDMQAALADFLFVCTEICIANERQKKNLNKFAKENPNTDDLPEDNEMLSAPAQDDSAKAADGDGDGAQTKGRRGKKNVPTIAQAMAVVEKIIPSIATLDEKLRALNPQYFAPIIDRLCTEMCIHFEALLEYGQPRKFWAKYLQMMKRSTSTAAAVMRQLSKATTSKAMERSTPSTARKTKARSHDDEEHDSGQFTIDDASQDGDSVSKQSTSTKRSRVTPISVKKPKTARYKSSSSGRGGRTNNSDSSSSSSDEDDASSASSFSMKRSTSSASNKTRQSHTPSTSKRLTRRR